MNMKKLLFFAFLMISMGLIFQACSDDNEVDTEKPVIEINDPLDGQHFHPGDEIHFDAEFSDNVELNQFKIDIHWGEGHDHKSSQNGEEWTYEYIGELSGRNQHVHMHIDIPENAKHGEYHFLVYCTDKAGNESWVALDIHIEDHDHDH